MSLPTLGQLELALANDQRFDLLDDTHLHRATFEDDLDLLDGRDALRDRRLDDVIAARGRPTAVLVDLGEMIVFETGEAWRGHRWVRREGARIIAETLVLDRAARADALEHERARVSAGLAATRHAHAPLGELRAGRGQLDEPVEPMLPPGWSDTAQAAARWLHAGWNRRMLLAAQLERWRGPGGSQGDAADRAAWIGEILRLLPDAVLLFERAIVACDRVALLWRLHGHHAGDTAGSHAQGRRVRAIGSSLLTMADGKVVAEETLLDLLAICAQVARQQVDYGPVQHSAQLG